MILMPMLSVCAQESNTFKFGIELGAGGSFSNRSGGIMFTLEPQYNITVKNSIGLRLRVGGFLGDDPLPRNSEFEARGGLGLTGYGSYSIVLTYDRYYGKGNKKFHPFYGLGLGLYKRSEFELDDPTRETFSIPIKPGIFLRTGFNLGKFRMLLEYNFISKVKLISSEGMPLPKINYSYLSMGLGISIGGGKWMVKY